MDRHAFHLLGKPTGAVCNLDCSYCFFLSKEQLYPGSRFRMDDAVLEAWVRQLLDAHPDGEVHLAWQGGEPTLMGLPHFEQAVALAERWCRPGQRVRYTVQTNATRIDDDLARFFGDNEFLVGVSLDGPRALHDRHRVTKGGAGSFDQVLAGWECLRRHGVETNVLCTVHADNADQPLPIYRFFRDELGARHLQFIPVVERVAGDSADRAGDGWGTARGPARPLYTQAGRLAAPRSVSGPAWGRFLIAVFDAWLRRDIGTVFVQAFDVALAAKFGRHELCIHAPECGDALALEHNGDLYSCDHYVEPGYRLGNILETPLPDLVAGPAQRAFGRAKQETLPRYCRRCDVLALCQGGCPKDRFATTPDGEPGLNHLCEGYRAFFRHLDPWLEFMAAELRAGRPPAGAMGEAARREAALAAAVARAGRNEPCPCGSGRKTKHCHGAGHVVGP
jgi:uncharacterized protein